MMNLDGMTEVGRSLCFTVPQMVSNLTYCQCHQCHGIIMVSHHEIVWAKQYHLLRCAEHLSAVR